MKIRKVIVWVLCVVLLLGLTGCSKAPSENAMSDKPGDYIAKEENSSDTNGSTSLPENRKLIQTVNMQVETEDLDAVLQQIDSRVTELGGYTESSSVQNGSVYSNRRYRNASITLRIPAKELDAFVNRVGEISNIVSSQKRVEDVTLSYVATESRMKALQTEQTRLLELMAKAETMADLLTIEERLTDVRTELEQVTSALRVIDNQVDYATIHLKIEEVKEYTQVTEPETVWQRIGTGFVKSVKGVGNFLEDLFVFLIVALPYFALLALFGFVGLSILRFSRRKKAKKTAQNDNPPEQN